MLRDAVRSKANEGLSSTLKDVTTCVCLEHIFSNHHIILTLITKHQPDQYNE